MNEKRFTLFGLDNETIKDDVTKECYWVNEYVQRKKLVDLLNEQQATIKQLESDKAIAEDYANIFEMENVKLRKKLNNYKATVLGFIWIMEQNGRISGKDDKLVKDLFKELENE